MAGDVVVLSGPPGAGKSTVAGLLARTWDRGVHLRMDDFWRAIVSGGIPPFLPESHAQNEAVVAAVAAAAREYALGGFTVVVDGVVGPWMLHHWTGGAPGVPRPHYVVLRPVRAVALARARARTGQDDLVDEAPILSLWQQFADLGELEPHVVDSTSKTPEETAQEVRAVIDAGTGSVSAPVRLRPR